MKTMRPPVYRLWLVSALFLLSGMSLAQPVPDSAYFKGKHYPVYPYRFDNSYYESGSFYNGEDLTPVAGGLADGSYIVLATLDYPKRHFPFFKRKYIRKDSLQVAGVVTIQEGIPNGPVTLYKKGFEEQPVVYGQYRKGLLDGTWVSLNTKGDTIAIKPWRDGHLHGKILRYHSGTKQLSAIEEYHHGTPMSDWNYYYRNGQLKLAYTIVDSTGEASQEFPYRDARRKWKILDGPYIQYHSNGKIRQRSYYRYGYLKLPDTTFKSNGKINEILSLIDFTQTSDGAILVKHKKERYNNWGNKEEILYLNKQIVAEVRGSYFANYKPDYFRYFLNLNLDQLSDTLLFTGKTDQVETYTHYPSAVKLKYYKDTLDGIWSYSYQYDSLTGVFSLVKQYQDVSKRLVIKHYSSDKVNLDQTLDERRTDLYKDSLLCYWNGKPYSGAFYYEQKHVPRKYNHTGQLKSKGLVFYDDGHHLIRALLPLRGQANGFFIEGKVSGTWQATVKRFRRSRGSRNVQYVASYKNGRKHGANLKYWPKKRRRFRLKPPEMYLREQAYYIDGFSNGVASEYYPNGTIKSIVSYEGGWRNGVQLEYDNRGLLTDQRFYLKGQPEGHWREFDSGYLLSSEYYQNGQLHGEVINKHHRLKHTTRVFHVHHGWLDSVWTEYHDNGSVKVLVEYDLKDSIKMGTSYQLTFKPTRTGNYEYFYKNGVEASQGRVQDGQRSGVWQFWNEAGQLVKRIDYTPGIIISALGDSTYHYGIVALFYPNGQKKCEGMLLSSEYAYDCTQDREVSLEDLYYQGFWLEDGTQVVANGEGLVTDRHPNGLLKATGSVLDGWKDGLWKTYNTQGHLNSFGSYVAGQKDGWWLTGDLQGIHDLEAQCFKTEAQLAAALKNAPAQTYIVKSHYTRGQLGLSKEYRPFKEPNHRRGGWHYGIDF